MPSLPEQKKEKAVAHMDSLTQPEGAATAGEVTPVTTLCHECGAPVEVPQLNGAEFCSNRCYQTFLFDKTYPEY
jgi:uncharacterized paraquat-inducible protein A